MAACKYSQGIQIASFLRNGIPRCRHEVTVNFSPSFDRKLLPEYDEAIEMYWKLQIARNSKIYNGSKFRFAGASSTADGVTMNVGITDYKSLIGTNCSPIGKELQRRGLADCENSQAFLADPLGVGSLLLTADTKFVFMKRALWTGEDAGKIDRPGGHPEPAVALRNSNITDGVSFHKLSGTVVAGEIFDSVLSEIQDEINLPREKLCDPLLLGVVRSDERCARPSVEFLVKCHLDSQQIEDLYRQGTQSEADESVDILFIAEEDVRLKHIAPSIRDQLTDSSRGAIHLYSQTVTPIP